MRNDVKHFIALPISICFVVALGAQFPRLQAAPAQAAPPPAARPVTQAAPAPAPRSVAPAAPAPAPRPVAQAEPAPAPRPVVPDPLRNEPINVRYEITIREEGGAQPSVKTVTMTGTLYEISLVRATSDPRSPLNVDVNPTALNGSKVRTKIGIEYTPPNAVAGSPFAGGPPSNAESTGASAPLIVRQAIHVWLDSGKSMVVSQAADPRSDRRLTVEVTATVLR
jgi:hypothetical protein